MCVDSLDLFDACLSSNLTMDISKSMYKAEIFRKTY